MDIKNSAITAKMVIHSLLVLLENENVDISSVKFKVGFDGKEYESPEFELEKLVSLAIDGLVEIEEANAVPEGFVLVPHELSADEARKHAEAMFNKVERMARNEQRDLSESEFELFKNRWIDARTLTIQFDWKAMIEAQEQSHE